MAICQTSSTVARRVGNSGLGPKPHNESCFVADEAPGRLDVEHTITASGGLVSVCIETTRNVGLVDADGLLVRADQHFAQGTLAQTLLLTIRARIEALEVGGTFGVPGPGGLLDVDVILHKDTPNVFPLGKLHGTFGIGPDDWQEFLVDVDIRHVKFPFVNPLGILPIGNEITFVLTGSNFPIRMEIDWLTLEPKNVPGLAWRPVMLVHGLGATSKSMKPGTKWADGLQARDIGFEPVDITPKGSVANNGAELAPLVEDLKARFGVQKIHMLGHSKGAIDGREYVKHHDDVETLIMLAGPNFGSFIADMCQYTTGASGTIGELIGGSFCMSNAFMRPYNFVTPRKPATTYVTVAGDHDGDWSNAVATIYGPNDNIVAVASVEFLGYAQAWTYFSSNFETDHSGLRFSSRNVDDLVPAYIGVLTAPPSPLRPLIGPTEPTRVPSRRVQDTAAAGVQALMSAAGLAEPGQTAAHIAIVDGGAAAIFVMVGDQDALRFELLDPAGSRVTPETTGAGVTYISYRDEGSLSYAGYLVQAPLSGNWTLDVIGSETAPAEGAPYIVTTSTPMTVGVGTTLVVSLDQERYAAGSTVTITAVFADADVSIADATIGATVTHPDGITTTAVVLTPDIAVRGAQEDGPYSGAFVATDPGLYNIVVSAERIDPACTRLAQLLVTVTASATALTGAFSDHGVDTNADGLFDELIIDAEVVVDLAGTYRLFATLTDGAGTAITQARVEQELQPGTQMASLAFDGARLFALGYDGAYGVENIVLEETASSLALSSPASYTTSIYTHTQFQRPLCVLTGRASDHGVQTDTLGLMPYEQLSVAVEVDTLAAAPVQARASLFSEDGTFITSVRTFVALPAGVSQVEFRFQARPIFQSGKAGPYTLRLFSLWGGGLELREPGIVCLTQPYALNDFAESPRFTLGGTVSGLEGTGLVLRDSHFVQITPGNGPFTFPLTARAGEAYSVTLVTHPSNPVQICTIANGSGTFGPANVTNVAVTCVTTPAEDGLDATFGGGGKVAIGTTGGAIGVAFQSDGKIVLLGARALTRYTIDGRLDTSFGVNGQAAIVFNGGVFDAAQGFAIQSDDAIVVVGFTRVGTSDDFAIARFDRNGAPDTTFGTGGKTSVDFSAGADRAWSVLIQPDGGLIVAGHAGLASPLGPDNDFALARLTARGVLDEEFGTNGKVTTNIGGRTDLGVTAALQIDGRILLAGRVIDSSGNEDLGLACYLANGDPDTSFGDQGITRLPMGDASGGLVAETIVQPDGRIIVVGSALAASAAPGGVSFGFAVRRFTISGQPDGEFGNGGLVTTTFSTQDDFGRGVALQAGKIVVVGQASNKVNSNFAIARYTSAGVLDSSFGDGGKLTIEFFGSFDSAECVAVQSDGRIVAAGSTRNVSTTALGMVRLASDA